MPTRTFALIVENEIAHVLPLDSLMFSATADRWAEGFLNNPVGMDITSYGEVPIGSVWDGQKFLPPESSL
jgi:hypothetical protein